MARRSYSRAALRSDLGLIDHARLIHGGGSAAAIWVNEAGCPSTLGSGCQIPGLVVVATYWEGFSMRSSGTPDIVRVALDLHTGAFVDGHPRRGDLGLVHRAQYVGGVGRIVVHEYFDAGGYRPPPNTALGSAGARVRLTSPPPSTPRGWQPARGCACPKATSTCRPA